MPPLFTVGQRPAVTDREDIDRFFADKSYEEVLIFLPEVMPRIGTILQRAHAHRTERVRNIFIDKHLHGLDNLLWYLEVTRDEMAAHAALHRVAFLIGKKGACQL